MRNLSSPKVSNPLYSCIEAYANMILARKACVNVTHRSLFIGRVHGHPHARRAARTLSSGSFREGGDLSNPCLQGDKESSCLLEPCMVDPEKPQPKVVIVGAGIAGLSAAQRLAHCGLTNITVLEATDRPGGRVYSCWLGDAVVELGAQWVLGACPNNSVYSLAAREGLLDCAPPTPATPSSPSPPSPCADPVFCTSDGRAVEPAVARAALHTFSLIESQAQAIFSLKLTKPKGALLTFLHRRIQQEVLRYPEELRYDVAAVLHGLATALRCRTGADLSTVSAEQYGSAVRVPGANLRLPLGFVGVLAPLLRDLPESTVHYCKVVKKIQWSGQGGEAGARATVRTEDGEVYAADYVILTVSLGVLKAAADTLFSPCLPGEKLDAIRGLGFGAVDKLFLQYERPFWARGGGAMQLAWPPGEMLDRDQGRDGWTKGIGMVEEVAGSRSVLCVWVAGEEARCVETLDDEAVAEGLTRVLRRFTGDPTLPFPETLLRSRWCDDPHFQGAVSFLGLDSSVGQQCDLGAPLPQASAMAGESVLLFAGEATCPGHFATAHGARLSGLREAERVLALTRKYKGPPPTGPTSKTNSLLSAG